MQVRVRDEDPVQLQTDALIALVPSSGRLAPFLRPLDAALGGAIRALLATGDFAGKSGEQMQLSATGTRAKRVLLVGVGDERKLSAELLRRAAGSAAKAAMARRARGMALVLPPLRRLRPADVGQALAEGSVLGSYRFDKYRTPEKPNVPPKEIDLVTGDGRRLAALRAGARSGEIISECVNFARDLSNEPGSVHTPVWLGEQARRSGREAGLRVRVFDERELRRRRMQGLLAVGRGAANPPRLIVAEYSPRGRAGARRPDLALVGKGITFDSGGISIKAAAGMEDMKYDMSGGAAVLGALLAAARLRLRLRLVGIVAAAQNMPDGRAYLPGDVVRTASGKTIEVQNTDAEGRVVLAEALHFARSLEPAAIVDVATLTGSCRATLGGYCAGVFGNDADLLARLRAAGDRCHERVWPLPLWDEHKEQIRSSIADIKNTGGRDAGASTAAAFLSHFVGDVPWAHLDIAGTEVAKKDGPCGVYGATGFGVRLLVELLRGWRQAR